MLIWEIRHRRRRSLPLLWWTKNPLVFFFFRLGCAVVTCTDLRSSKPCSRTHIRYGRSLETRNFPLPARFIHTPAHVAVAPRPRGGGGGRKNPHQCQKKDEHSSSVGASVALLIFLIEFIYLSSFNNLRCSTQWYANELFKFNEFLMTRQIISRARCGVHVIWGGINWSALLNVWVQTA